jgi:hypothetical protein
VAELSKLYRTCLGLLDVLLYLTNGAAGRARKEKAPLGEMYLIGCVLCVGILGYSLVETRL